MDIFEEAVRLKPDKRAELVDTLLSSLNRPDKEIDGLWAEEVDSRIEAHEQGKIKAISLAEVLEKYR